VQASFQGAGVVKNPPLCRSTSLITVNDRMKENKGYNKAKKNQRIARQVSKRQLAEVEKITPRKIDGVKFEKALIDKNCKT
jgi:hypothetical protein